MSDRLIEGFLEFKGANQARAAGTVSAYRAWLLRLAEFLDARGRRVLEASDEDLVQFVGAHLHSAGVRPRSRRPAVAAVREFYSWCVRAKHLRANPAKHLQYPKVGTKLPTKLELRYAEQLFMEPNLDTFIGVRDTAMFGLLLGCGLRVSGLVALNQEHLLRDDTDGFDSWYIKVTEKGGNDRIVPIPQESTLMLRAYLGHPVLNEYDRTLPNTERVLFISTANRTTPPHELFGEQLRISVQSVQRRIIHYGKQAGVPRAQLHPHAFRHLYGTELAEASTDIRARQALMGHKSVTSTMLYDAMAARRLRKAANEGSPMRKIKTPFSELSNRLTSVNENA